MWIRSQCKWDLIKVSSVYIWEKGCEQTTHIPVPVFQMPQDEEV